MNLDIHVNNFIVLWAVIDPVGTVPVFLAVTKNYGEVEKKRVAKVASVTSFVILSFFMLVGEMLLRRMGVPLAAFQTSGGVILFIFAMNMIFGSSKPEEEIQLIKTGSETAIFPLAIPSIASPGAILAVVLLADTTRKSFADQSIIFLSVLVILIVNYTFMLFSKKLQEKIGNTGAIVISKVMGLIIASVAANNVLLGVKTFFKV